MSALTYGAMFAGYGGLELGAQAALGGHTRWHAENDAAPSRILARHWPGVPNLGDVTQIDWSSVQPVDVITGGSPCQDLSVAGRRAGMRPGTRSGLWSAMCRAIDVIRPRLVIWENVRGALSAPAASGVEPCQGCMGDDRQRPALRALGRVLGDLADLGYDATWESIPASDVGAAHLRWRVFVLAWRRGSDLSDLTPAGTPSSPDRIADLLPTPRTSDSTGPGVHGAGGLDLKTAIHYLPTPSAVSRQSATEATRLLLPTPRATDGTKGGPNQRGTSGELALPSAVQEERFGRFREAIARHGEAIGRPAPIPTRSARSGTGSQQLTPEFVEWLMMLPAGHVTGTAGLTRTEQLRALGNGVVPPQAAEGIRRCASRISDAIGGGLR